MGGRSRRRSASAWRDISVVIMLPAGFGSTDKAAVLGKPLNGLRLALFLRAGHHGAQMKSPGFRRSEGVPAFWVRRGVEQCGCRARSADNELSVLATKVGVYIDSSATRVVGMK